MAFPKFERLVLEDNQQKLLRLSEMASTSHPTFDEKKDALWDHWRDDEGKRRELKAVAEFSEDTAELFISAWYDKEKSSFVEENKKREEEAQKKAWWAVLQPLFGETKEEREARKAEFERALRLFIDDNGFEMVDRLMEKIEREEQAEEAKVHREIASLLYLPDDGSRTDSGGMGENGYHYRFHGSTLPIILKGLKMVHAEVTSNVKVTFEKFPEPEPETEEKKEEEDTEDLSEDEDEEEDEVFEDITVDGIDYQLNKEDNRLMRVEDFKEVGVWNAETKSIDFDEEEDG